MKDKFVFSRTELHTRMKKKCEAKEDWFIFVELTERVNKEKIPSEVFEISYSITYGFFHPVVEKIFDADPR